MSIKVRFAPSPTGHLHIGGLRAALFNYYFARKNDGIFVIRIEDTDHQRNSKEYIKSIFDAFLWCNIESDQEIVYQSKREAIYKKYIKNLLKAGIAYYSEELDEDGQVSKVIKCRIPRDKKSIDFDDVIRGKISFPTEEYNDFIIVRSDGSPLYNLVVVIDDIEMGISHIIRGEEHLPNTPKQIILYEAFGARVPQFAHLPLILGEDRKKLSKRLSAVSVFDYQKQGILPEALSNYLIRLGWAYKDQEIFTYDEIIKYFKLEDVHHSSAIFDENKLHSMNHFFIKNASSKYLYKRLYELESVSLNSLDENIDLEIIDLFKGRARTLLDLYEGILLVKNEPQYDDFKNLEENELVKKIIALFKQSLIDRIPFKSFISDFLKKGYEQKIVYRAVRFAILGKTESPSILSILDILGRDGALQRIEKFFSCCSE